MAGPARAGKSIEQLIAELNDLPGNVKGEIIDGELYVQPRPPVLARAKVVLGSLVGGPYDFDEAGPGGWWIAIEPGIELPDAPEIAPDLVGWRRERVSSPPGDEGPHPVPDWVCEVLSPSNAR